MSFSDQMAQYYFVDDCSNENQYCEMDSQQKPRFKMGAIKGMVTTLASRIDEVNKSVLKNQENIRKMQSDLNTSNTGGRKRKRKRKRKTKRKKRRKSKRKRRRKKRTRRRR